MISSLLSMQNRRVQELESKELLHHTQNRVKSIGLIHEHLYQGDQFGGINLKSYISQLVEMLIKSLYIKDIKPKVELNIMDEQVDLDSSVHVGLIINELVTNSIKYGLSQSEHPELRILLYKEAEILVLEVKDNGPGGKVKKNGFGWTIIESTLNSIGGHAEVNNSEGFHVTIRINDYILVGNGSESIHH